MTVVSTLVDSTADSVVLMISEDLRVAGSGTVADLGLQTVRRIREVQTFLAVARRSEVLHEEVHLVQVRIVVRHAEVAAHHTAAVREDGIDI